MIEQFFRTISIAIMACPFITSLLILSPFFSSTALARDIQSRNISQSITPISIQKLERIATVNPAWVQARIVERKDEDLYLIQDRSGQILLFLSTDELAECDFEIGQELFIFGTVDINPTGGQNELYAKKIYLAAPSQ